MSVWQRAFMSSMATIVLMMLLSLGVGTEVEGSRDDSEHNCINSQGAGELDEDMTAMVQVAAVVPSRKAAPQLSVEPPAAGAAATAKAAEGQPKAHDEGHLRFPHILLATRMAIYIEEQQLVLGLLILVVGILPVLCKLLYPNSTALTAICCGVFYIMISAAMIETNKWLMMPNHFPYPLALTMNHMTVSFICCSILLRVSPSAFPAMEKINVDWSFCRKFIPIGAAFALSIVCGNAAYRFVSVSFLQIMKQSNIVTIYFFSTIFGLESLRKCNVLILIGVLSGSWMGVNGELHFKMIGFLLQVVSSLSEATKVIIQSVLMSGSAKLDPLTMVLFMAPSCLLANTVPFAVLEGVKFREILAHAWGVAPMLALNALMAFGLNLSVAICIKRLSAVGYLLCGVVKDVCIIVSSSFLLGDSLSGQQIFGFCCALFGVFSYSMYKQNQDCFHDDALFSGASRVVKKLKGEKYLDASNDCSLPPQPVKSG